MTSKIHVEGGGNNPDTIKRCKQGFAEYCRKLSPPNRRPAIVACGSRQDAFGRFKIAVSSGRAGERFALLADSEGPVHQNLSPAAFLQSRDRWESAGLSIDYVFLMVQAMEAWFLADRAALAAYYEDGFRPDNLPYDERRIEEIPKHDLEPCLVRASRGTTTKGSYHKTRHAFALLAEIDPAKVGAGSPHAAAFNEFVRSL